MWKSNVEEFQQVGDDGTIIRAFFYSEVI